MSDRFVVLLVEDNEDDVAITQIVLKKLKLPVTLTVVDNGRDALEALCAGLPDLVLLDLNLPVLGGLEILAQAKARLGERCPPVLILTTSTAPHEMAEAFRLGAQGYHAKPFQLDAFTILLRDILAKWMPQASNT